MKKLVLLFLAVFCFRALSFGQDFTFEELTKLRSYSYPKFESAVHEKGYEMAHLDNCDNCTVFRNGTSVISYCILYDDGFSWHNHVAVKYETASREAYEKVKKSVSSSMDYYKTKLRRRTEEHSMDHMYVNDALSVHLIDMAFRDDDKAYYEVDVYSLYSGY
jgi:hypothetical protein